MAWTQHQPPLAQIKRIARKVLDNKAADYREAEYRDAERFYRRLTRQGVDRPTAMGELATFYWRLSHAVGIMRRQDARKHRSELGRVFGQRCFRERPVSPTTRRRHPVAIERALAVTLAGPFSPPSIGCVALP